MEMEYFVRPAPTTRVARVLGATERVSWYTSYGIRPENLRIRDHDAGRARALLRRARRTSSTCSRSAGASWRASPTAATTTLRHHEEFSGEDLTTSTRRPRSTILPYVIEPAVGAGPRDARLPARRLRRGADDEGEKRHARRAAPPPGDRAVQGRRCCRCSRKRAAGRRWRRRSHARLRPHWMTIRRDAGDRPALPPPGRDRHALLRDGRLPEPGGPRRHRARPRHHDAGARTHRGACRLARRSTLE